MRAAFIVIAVFAGCTSSAPAGLEAPDAAPPSGRADAQPAAPEPQRPDAAEPAPDAPAEAPQVPYPDATALPPGLASAPSADSECGGALDVLPEVLERGGAPRYRDGAWALGDASGFDPLLVFNTRASAEACRGSSDWSVRTFAQGRWR